MKILSEAKWSKSLLLAMVPLMVACGGGSDDDDDDDDDSGAGLRSDACDVLGLKIIDGAECKTADSPVISYDVFYSNRTPTTCSGTMITPDAILTAAHCFANFGDNVIRINVQVNGQSIDAPSFGIHPNYSEQSANVAGGFLLFNDVAIIDVPNAPSVPLVPLYVSRGIQRNDIFSIFGYGLDENGKAGKLRSGEMQIDSVFGNQFSAFFGGEGSNTCQGDSGGPALLTVDGRTGIIGLTSSGDPSKGCFEGDLSIFANTQDTSIMNYIVSMAPSVGKI